MPDGSSFWLFQALILGRSALVLVGLMIVEWMIHCHPFIIMLMSRAVQVTPSRLSVFGIKVAGDPRRILGSYVWVVRAAVTVSLCYLWDALIVNSHVLNVNSISQANQLKRDCEVGWNCYALYNFKEPIPPLQTRHEFIRISFLWDLVTVCPFTATPYLQEISARRASVTCWKFGDPTFVNIATGVTITCAIFVIIVTAFEGITAILIRHRKHRVNAATVVDTILFLSIVFWVAQLIMESLNAVSCWVTRLVYLVIPLTLFHSRVVSNDLRRQMAIRNDLRAQQLVESELGIEIDKVCKRSPSLSKVSAGGVGCRQ